MGLKLLKQIELKAKCHCFSTCGYYMDHKQGQILSSLRQITQNEPLVESTTDTERSGICQGAE